MRRDYAIENGSLAWGYEPQSGFFVQVFDEKIDEDVPVLDADHSDVTAGFLLAEEKLTYQKMIDVLEARCPKAMQEFESYAKQEMEEPSRGYLYNKQGKHNGAIDLRTWGDLFRFLDRVRDHTKFTITDVWDNLVLSRR